MPPDNAVGRWRLPIGADAYPSTTTTDSLAISGWRKKVLLSHPPSTVTTDRLEWGMFNYPTRFGRHKLAASGYAVIDLETTGFDAWGADRIVEIAIVRIDAGGRELGVYETLVNPGRSTGAVGVHQISTAMAARAPTFGQIASSVLAWLEGVVVVAHNAPFEDAFLSAEFARAGIALPTLPALDTLPLAQTRVPTPNHRLATVCAWAGVTIDGPHTALGDARATAQVLPRLLAMRRTVPRWRHGFSRLGGAMGGGYLPRRVSTAPGAALNVSG